MRILAIDPGYEKVGIAVLEKAGGKEKLLFSTCYITSRKLSPAARLVAIGKEVCRVIKKFQPQGLAIEKLFFTANQKTAMLVGEARGVIVYEAARAGLPVFEYTPLEVKVAVTGYGRSGKNQITFMVEKLIAVGKKIKEDDEYDAIALGLTCFARERFKT